MHWFWQELHTFWSIWTVNSIAQCRWSKAVALNPNHGGVWHARSQVAFMCCNPDECIRSMAQSIRFNPKDPAMRSFWIGTSWALWMKGQYEEGLSLADKAIQFRATPWSLGAYI